MQRHLWRFEKLWRHLKDPLCRLGHTQSKNILRNPSKSLYYAKSSSIFWKDSIVQRSNNAHFTLIPRTISSLTFPFFLCIILAVVFCLSFLDVQYLSISDIVVKFRSSRSGTWLKCDVKSECKWHIRMDLTAIKSYSTT